MNRVFDGFLATPEALDAFSDSNFVRAMLRVEAALASAQSAVGLIPEASAKTITDTCKVELFDVARIVRESARAGSIAIPLVKALKDTVGLFNPDAVAHVHLGTTSQDVVDTAMVLVTREALVGIEVDTARAVEALLALAAQHAATPMLARTLMQPASVTSFGLKCVGWAAPLVRSRARLRATAHNALQLQLGGAVGTLAEMRGHGPAVAAHVALELDLREPPGPWHTQRDEWLALGCELGLVVGSLGKIARDISLLGQFEVAEVSEPDEPGRGGSTTMAHKHNPAASMIALAAAQRAPQRVAALLASMPQEHERALGHWQAELADWPELVMAAHGSARAMAGALVGLRVDPARMRANLDAVRASVPRATAQEWFDPALAGHAARMASVQGERLRALLDADAA
jgi:3-carboxy-cis,cis-muconate cycloisomerase